MSARISTTIKTRKSTPGEILGGVFGSIVLFTIAYFLVEADLGIWAILVALVGVGVFINIFLGGETAPCPNCKHQFKKIDTLDRWFLCPACEKYMERTEESRSQLQMIEDDYICEDLIFMVKVPRGNYFPKWPPGCCICGKEKYKTGIAENTLISRGSTTYTTMKFSVSGIPYCEKHYIAYSERGERGVGLHERPTHSKMLVNPEEGDAHVMNFRSYKYFRAFRALNHW
jgi:hypothetical protein